MSKKEIVSQRCDAMSGSERSRKSRANRPQSAARDKERQRNLERIYLFHITRAERYGYELPESIDQESKMFFRVRSAYRAKLKEAVEVEVLYV